MMRYSFWYGGWRSDDLEWLEEAVSLLKKNDWKEGIPLYLDGTGWGEEKVRETAAINLLQALRDNTSAETLFVRNVDLGEKALSALIDVFEKNCHLKSISIKNVRFGEQPLTLPISIFKKAPIKELKLEKIHLDATGCNALGEMLSKSTGLSTLYLENVSIEGGLSSLTGALSKARSLQKLVLKGKRYDQGELEGLFKVIGSNRSLRTVQLERLGIGEAHASGLADLLARNQYLQNISLRNNDLNGPAVKTLLLEGLCRNETLQELFLSRNPIGDDGAFAIATALQKNSTLLSLCLVHCEIWSEGCRAIAMGLAKMKGLRLLDIDCNEMEFCAPEILQSLKEGNCILTQFTKRLGALVQNADAEGDNENMALWNEIDAYLGWNKAGRRVLAETNADRLLPMVFSSASENLDTLFLFLQHTSF